MTATDGGGLTNSGSATYTVDRQVDAPTLSLATSSGTGHRITATATDPVADLASLTCTVSDDHGTTVLAPAPCATSTKLDLPAAALDGDYTVTTTATDTVGNTATTSLTYTLLQSAPVLDPLPAPSTARLVPVSFSPGADVASVDCSVVGPHGFSWSDSSCTSPMSFAIPAGGWDGDYVLTVTVTDHLGHSLSAQDTYTLLQSAPVLDPLPAPSTARLVPVSFSPGADVASVDCSVVGPHGFSWSDSSCTSPMSFAIPAGGWDGDYVLTVTVTDHLGHSLSAQDTYTLLQSAPVLDPLPAPSTARLVPVSFSPGADVASVDCSVVGPHGFSWSDSSCTSPMSFAIPAGGWDGDYVLTVTVTDHLGHSLSAQDTYTLLPSAPSVTTAAASPASVRKPSWTIASAVANFSHYECDSAVPVLQCTSTVQLDLTGLVDGTYTVDVVAVDADGVKSAPTTLSVTLIPPAPFATLPASSPTSTRQPQWTISDRVIDLAGYDCQSDVPVLVCGATVRLDLRGLVDGTYSVAVRAIDSLGVLGDTTTFSVTLVAPAPRVVTPAASPSSERQPAWAIADDVVDFDHYDCSSTVPLLSCGATVQLDLTGLADGVYSVTVRAVDSLGVAGDPMTLSYTMVAPAPTVVSAPTSPASTLKPSWVITDGATNVDHYTCSTSVAVLSCGPTVKLNLTGLVDGTYTVVVRAVDSAGNAGDPLTLTFTLIPPAPAVVSAPTSPASMVKPAWVLSDGAVDVDHYMCTTSVAVLSCGSTVQLNLTGLVDGTYSVVVQAVDSLGVAGDPVTLSFALIPPAPSVAAAPTSPSSDAQPVWQLTDGVVDLDHYTCTTSVPVVSCGSTVQLDLRGLAGGTYSVIVRAVDSSGSAGDPLTLTYTVIATAPHVVSSPASPASTLTPSWTIADDITNLDHYICNSHGAGGLLRVDGAAEPGWSSGWHVFGHCPRRGLRRKRR